MKLRDVVAGAAFTALATGVAFAHSGASGVVKQRMDAMGEIGKAMKAMAPMMRGEIAYDPDTVRSATNIIAERAGAHLTKMFPEGSLHKPTEAKLEIWQDWDEFEALANRLEVLAGSLAQAAGNGLMASDSGMAQGMASGGMAGSGMMAGGMMAGGMTGPLDPDALNAMPADSLFMMVSQTCSGCHTKFRIEQK